MKEQFPRNVVDLVDDLATDMGLDPNELRIRFDLSMRLAVLMDDRGITIGEAATIAGMDAGEVERIATGRVANCSIWQLLRLMAAMGHDVAIDIYPTGGGIGSVYVAR